MSEEHLTTREVAKEFKTNESTLRSWRRLRLTDKRYPRYHKLFTGKVYYVRAEIEADMKNMEVPADKMEMKL